MGNAGFERSHGIAGGGFEEVAIHAPRITGATPGRPFLFRVPATGRGPLTFSAENLPAGLSLDPATGIITGLLAEDGTTEVAVSVESSHGLARSKLTIVGGKNSLAITPPMGWNSWNVWGASVDDAKIRAAAEAMVRTGLAGCGYQYINIDDAWEGERDGDGVLQPNGKFPDMKGLADYVHRLGLKLGIYTSPGPKTCQGFEGSYEHDEIDAQTYAEWGIDYLKHDWCSYRDIIPDESRQEHRKPYEVMRAALDACGRDIVYSICQYGFGRVWEWGEDVGGNLWRTTEDIFDAWESMAYIGFSQNGLEGFAGPGHWNDPDMLVVGRVGWGPTLHETRLTPDEQITHITLWSMLAAPLLLGCDLTRLDEFTLALISNPEVIEVDQDPLGCQGRRVNAECDYQVWARPLNDGGLAVALFNLTEAEATVTADWRALGLKGGRAVRNLWMRRDEGVFDEAFSARVPAHGAVMLNISPAR